MTEIHTKPDGSILKESYKIRSGDAASLNNYLRKILEPEIYSNVIKQGRSEIHKIIKEFIQFGQLLRNSVKFSFRCEYGQGPYSIMESSEDVKTILHVSNSRFTSVINPVHSKLDLKSILERGVLLNTGYSGYKVLNYDLNPPPPKSDPHTHNHGDYP